VRVAVVKIEIKHNTELTAAERAWFETWSRQIFGADFDRYEWAPVDWHFFVYVEELPPSRAVSTGAAGVIPPAPVERGAREPDLPWSGQALPVPDTPGQPVCEAAICERTAIAAGQRVRLAGVTNVMTLPSWRGRGYATAAVQRAHAFACERLGAAFSLLFCDEVKVNLYRRAGWEVVEGPVVVEQRGARMEWPPVYMVRPCGAAPWPGGPIDLCGPPW
jgi:GNAT superfamily N-acetyltransferase